jgi:hypothetical protein
VEADVEKLWDLLSYRESSISALPTSPPPFLKAKIRAMTESLTFLLPTQVTFSMIIKEAIAAFARRCLSAKNITLGSAIQLTGPLCFQTLIFGDEQLDDALHTLQDAIELEQQVTRSCALDILQPLETCPPYSELDDETKTSTERRSSVDVLADFSLRPTYEDRDGGVIDLEIARW